MHKEAEAESNCLGGWAPTDVNSRWSRGPSKLSRILSVSSPFPFCHKHALSVDQPLCVVALSYRILFFVGKTVNNSPKARKFRYEIQEDGFWVGCWLDGRIHCVLPGKRLRCVANLCSQIGLSFSRLHP